MHINFLNDQGSAINQKAVKEWFADFQFDRLRMLIILVSLVVVMFSFSGIQKWRINSLNDDVNLLRMKVESLKSSLKSQGTVLISEKKKNEVLVLFQNRAHWSAYLGNIAANIPSYVEIISIRGEESKKVFIMEGFAVDQTAVTNLVQVLENVEGVSAVKLISSQSDSNQKGLDEGKGKARAKFQLSCHFE